MTNGTTETIIAKVLQLKRFTAFSDLSASALKGLASQASELTFEANDTVLASGTPVDAAYFILSGAIDEWRDERCLRRHAAGDILAGAAVLAAQPPSCITARATCPTRVLRVSRESLFSAQDDCFPLQRALLKAIGYAELVARARLGWEKVYDNSSPSTFDTTPNPACELGQRVVFLREAREFRHLRLRTLGSLAADSEIVDLKKGEVLWHEGDAPDYAVQVVSGALDCRPNNSPDFRVRSGALLGLNEALAERPRWCEVVAARSVTMVRLQVEDIFDALEDDPDVAIDLMNILAGDVLELQERIACSAAETDL